MFNLMNNWDEYIEVSQELLIAHSSNASYVDLGTYRTFDTKWSLYKYNNKLHKCKVIVDAAQTK